MKMLHKRGDNMYKDKHVNAEVQGCAEREGCKECEYCELRKGWKG